MQSRHILYGLLVVVVIVIISLLSSKESFKHVGMAAQLPDGLYFIKSGNNHLTSNIIDTVQCHDFLIGKTAPSQDTAWQIQRVASGVYILFKPGKQECMYSSPANELRSFFFPSCTGKNLCGLEQPDFRGELDPDSLSTYFMILQNPDGKFYLKNMKNNKYVNMTSTKLFLSNSPKQSSLFEIIPVLH